MSKKKKWGIGIISIVAILVLAVGIFFYWSKGYSEEFATVELYVDINDLEMLGQYAVYVTDHYFFTFDINEADEKWRCPDRILTPAGWRLTLRNIHAYVKSAGYLCYVFDVSAPNMPSLKSEFMAYGIKYGDILAVDDLLIVTGRYWTKFYDITDPINPTLTDSLESTIFRNEPRIRITSDNTWGNRLVCITDSDGGSLVFDVRDPANIKKVEDYHELGLRASCVHNSRHFVSLGKEGLRTAPVGSIPSIPILEPEDQSGWQYYKLLKGKGNLLFGVFRDDEDFALHVLDITKAGKDMVLARYNMDNNVNIMNVNKGIVDSTECIIVSVVDDSNLRLFRF